MPTARHLSPLGGIPLTHLVPTATIGTIRDFFLSDPAEPHAMVVFAPPGVGKTTTIRVSAAASKAVYIGIRFEKDPVALRYIEECKQAVSGFHDRCPFSVLMDALTAPAVQFFQRLAISVLAVVRRAVEVCKWVFFFR